MLKYSIWEELESIIITNLKEKIRHLGFFFTKLKLSSIENNLSQYVGENMRAICKAQDVSIWRQLKHDPKTKKCKLPIKLKLFPFGDGLNSTLKKSFIYSSTFSLNYLGECIF